MYAHTTWPPPGPKAPHTVGAPIPGVRAAAGTTMPAAALPPGTEAPHSVGARIPGVRAAAGSTTPAAPLPVCAATGPRFLGRWSR
ncbi:hypothetical protein ACIQ9R_33795 [Streptomyces sp. NPDC094447]|uniref:hypothetical protein n=1 Tax=Streptomyces sp. NPDC094447 TaxID=3366062 RepID=UPI0037F9CBA3